MPAIGAEVADAYIEVHADTGPFRRELRREASLAAREASDEFGVEFTKAIDKDLDPLGVKVSRQLRKMGELGGQNLIEEIADQVRSRADRINKAFATSITFGDFAPFIESFNNFDDAIEDFGLRMRALNKDGTLTERTFKRLNAAFDAYVKTIQDDAIEQALNDQRKASVAALEAEEKRVARQTQINDIFTRDFQKNVSKIQAAQEKLSNALVEVDRESPTFKAVSEDLKQLEIGLFQAEKEARRFNIGLGSLKGSRNDFLNFIGSLSGFLERNIGKGLETLFEGIGSGVTKLGKSLSGIDGPLGAVGRKMDGLGGSISKLGAGGLDGLIIQVAAFSISLQLLVAVAGPLTSLISGLTAAMAALAVGVGGALLGGVVALGPAMTALAAGIAAVSIGFSDMNKAQERMFGPLKELFEEVRNTIQGRLFDGLGDQVETLTRALAPLGPFLGQLAGVFRNWVNQVVSEIGPNGPLAATFESLGSSLPGIFRTLLDLVSATGGALAGLFAGAAPGARQLFVAITGVVERFSAWANSVKGQRIINEFMQQAIDLLNNLWDIATAVGNTLRIMWSGGGAEAAQVLLSAIAGIVERMNAWLSTRAGQEALLAFFRNGVTVARGLGSIVVGLVELFNALDTEFTRLVLTNVFNFIRTGIGVFTSFARTTGDLVKVIIRVIAEVNTFMTRFGNLGRIAVQNGQAFRSSLISAFNAVRSGISSLITAFLNVNITIANFAARARAVLAAFAGAAGAVVGRVAAGLRSLAASAASALGAFVGSIARGVSSGLSALGQFAGRAVAALASLPGRFASLGVSIMQGLFNGVVSGAGRVLSYISGLADQVAGAFSRALGIASPSKVFRSLGGFIIEGLIDGMRRREREAEKESDRIANGVIDSAINVLRTASGRLRSTAEIITQAIARGGNNPALNKVFKQLGERAIQSLTNGLSRGRDAARSDIADIIKRISDVARKAMEGENKRTRTIIANQAAALQQWVRGQAQALDAIWREVDRAGVRLDRARERLQELQQEYLQMRQQVTDSLRGELDLSGAIGDDGTASFETVASQVSSLAARMKKFAGLIKRLIKAGFPAALVQEVAALGSAEGIAVANALLSGTKAQQADLISDFQSIQSSTAAIGKALAEQMFRAGIDAQKGLIKGLEANQEALLRAARKIAKTITDEIKRELGIKSPSTVFRQLGEFIAEGLALGIEGGTDRVASAVTGLVDPNALRNVNAPISSLAAGQTASGGASTVAGGIASGAITIVTPYANPRLVAIEALDALAARGK